MKSDEILKIEWYQMWKDIEFEALEAFHSKTGWFPGSNRKSTLDVYSKSDTKNIHDSYSHIQAVKRNNKKMSKHNQTTQFSTFNLACLIVASWNCGDFRIWTELDTVLRPSTHFSVNVETIDTIETIRRCESFLSQLDEVLEVSILDLQDQDCPVDILPQWAALERDRDNVPQEMMEKWRNDDDKPTRHSRTHNHPSSLIHIRIQYIHV